MRIFIGNFMYRITMNISSHRDFETTDAVDTLRKELCIHIAHDVNELHHKELVSAFANTMINSEAAEVAWEKGFIAAILSVQ